MMQNSLERLFGGMAEALRDVVLPEVDDEYARAQAAACIELLGNLSTRVEWRSDQLREVTEKADAAVAGAVAAAPGLLDAVRSPAGAEAVPARAGESPAVAARDGALARVSAAIRWCDDHPGEHGARTPLIEFARWHLDHELTLLRTGMFSG